MADAHLIHGRGIKRRRQRDGNAVGKRQKLQLSRTVLVEVLEGRPTPIQETEVTTTMVATATNRLEIMQNDRSGNQLDLPVPNLNMGRHTLRVRHAAGIFDPYTNIVTLHGLQGMQRRCAADAGIRLGRRNFAIASVMKAVILRN